MEPSLLSLLLTQHFSRIWTILVWTTQSVPLLSSYLTTWLQMYFHFTSYWFYLFPFQVRTLFSFPPRHRCSAGEVNFCWQNSVEQKIFVVTVYKIVEVNFILCPGVLADWMVSMCDCMTCSERCLHSCINTTMLKRFWDFL